MRITETASNRQRTQHMVAAASNFIDCRSSVIKYLFKNKLKLSHMRSPSALLITALVIGTVPSIGRATDLPTVTPVAVTSPMQGTEDVADDVCVWVDRIHPVQSVIIGINKSDEVHGGLYLFDLDGSPLQETSKWVAGSNWFAPGKKLNNVDSVAGFPVGNETWDLVCASNRTDRALDVFRVRTSVGRFSHLEHVGRVAIGTGFASDDDAPYGIAMVEGSQTKVWSAMISDKLGRVAQIELQFNKDGTGHHQITGIRHDNKGQPWQISQTGCPIEGIVADPTYQAVYIAAEDEGIFRYQLRNGILSIDSKQIVDSVGSRLQDDIEGLTMYKQPDGAGYLLASSQGSSQYAAYDRQYKQGQPNQHVSNFQIGQTADFDAVQSTDGIDAVFGNFGKAFPRGLLIAHDGEGSSPTHYKIVPWSHVESVLLKATTRNQLPSQ